MKVYFIGAGPGDPELITMRGLRLIERCQVCLYAGSLVPAAVVVLVCRGWAASCPRPCVWGLSAPATYRGAAATRTTP